MPDDVSDKTLPRVHWFPWNTMPYPSCFRSGILPLNEILFSIKANLDLLAQKKRHTSPA
jgi:hypothetical protein